MDTQPTLFKASDIARFCSVDLKTIHNWADKGEINHFRTPGRHLRFRRNGVLDFLRKYGYPIPDVLSRTSTVNVVLIEDNLGAVASIKRALGKRFEVTSYSDVIDAIVSLGGEPPDALVMDLRLEGVDANLLFNRLRKITSTSHIRMVVVSAEAGDRDGAIEAGADDFIMKGDWTGLRDTLETLLGIGT